MAKFWRVVRELLALLAYLFAIVAFLADKLDVATFWMAMAIYMEVTKEEKP